MASASGNGHSSGKQRSGVAGASLPSTAQMAVRTIPATPYTTKLVDQPKFSIRAGEKA